MSDDQRIESDAARILVRAADIQRFRTQQWLRSCEEVREYLDYYLRYKTTNSQDASARYWLTQGQGSLLANGLDLLYQTLTISTISEHPHA